MSSCVKISDDPYVPPVFPIQPFLLPERPILPTRPAFPILGIKKSSYQTVVLVVELVVVDEVVVVVVVEHVYSSAFGTVRPRTWDNQRFIIK